MVTVEACAAVPTVLPLHVMVGPLVTVSHE
jgi:hypothetical protein